MSQFDLSVYAPSTDPIEYEIHFMEGTPRPKLLVVPAGEINPPYIKGQIRHLAKNPSKATHITVDRLKEDRNLDRELFALHVIKGWENIFNRNGEPVPFSPSACQELLEAFPDNLFDELRAFAKDLTRFTRSGELEKN